MFTRKVVGVLAGTGALGTFAYYQYKKRNVNRNSQNSFGLHPALLYFNERQEENIFEDYGMNRSDISESEFTNYMDNKLKDQVLNICLENELTKDVEINKNVESVQEEIVWDEKTFQLLDEEFPQVLEYAKRIVQLEHLIEDTHQQVQLVKDKKKEVKVQCQEMIQSTIKDQSQLLAEYRQKEYEKRDEMITKFVANYLLNVILLSWKIKVTEHASKRDMKTIDEYLHQSETNFQQNAYKAITEYEQQLQTFCTESREKFSSVFLPDASKEHFESLEELVNKSTSEMKRAQVELGKLQRVVVLQMELQKLLHHPGRAYFPKALLEEINVILENDSLKRVLKNKQMDLFSLPALKGELRKLANQKTVPVSPESTMIGQSLTHLQKCLSNPPEFIAIGNQTEDILDRTCYFLERHSSLINTMKEIETLPPSLQLTLQDWKYKAQDRLALEVTNKILLLTIQEALHKYNH